MSKHTQGDAEKVFALRMLMAKYAITPAEICRLLTILTIKEKK